MNSCNEYCLADINNKVIAMGSRKVIFSYVKHHVEDGRYRITGPELMVDCIRANGVVGPDPDGVCWGRKETK